MLIAILALVAAYLIGAIPFGWLIARSRGVDLFHVGSGNIGATNVGRVLGRRWGFLVFGLDFAKGALPIAASQILPTEAHESLGLPNALRVGIGLCAFLGHMFPIYLRFRGGKGVATGAGVVFVLVPGPATLAILVFAATACTFRMISLGSIAAAGMLCGSRLLSVADPFDRNHIVVTAFCLAGTLLLLVKHRANIARLMNGTENRLEDTPMLGTIARAIHVLALGTWFGAMVMFNFIVAPTQFFEAFPAVVESAPSDRTAYLPITAGANEEQKKQLATALAGSAVGTVFPKFFRLQATCAVLALITALGWWRCNGQTWSGHSVTGRVRIREGERQSEAASESGHGATGPHRTGRVHRWRVIVLVIALATIAIGWPISSKVSALRVERFHPDASIADAAKASFSEMHMISLWLSMLSALLVGIGLAMAAKMPARATTLPDRPVADPPPSPGGG